MQGSDHPGAKSIAKFGEDNNLGKSFIYDEIRAGRITAVKAGARTLITNAEEARYFRSLPVLDAQKARRRVMPAQEARLARKAAA